MQPRLQPLLSRGADDAFVRSGQILLQRGEQALELLRHHPRGLLRRGLRYLQPHGQGRGVGGRHPREHEDSQDVQNPSGLPGLPLLPGAQLARVHDRGLHQVLGLGAHHVGRDHICLCDLLHPRRHRVHPCQRRLWRSSRAEVVRLPAAHRLQPRPGHAGGRELARGVRPAARDTLDPGRALLLLHHVHDPRGAQHHHRRVRGQRGGDRELPARFPRAEGDGGQGEVRQGDARLLHGYGPGRLGNGDFAGGEGVLLRHTGAVLLPGSRHRPTGHRATVPLDRR
mmetsp:Transcript_132195/g.410854  ORF Transcript_132195/g.410854 Transcript_132195/m.410854 type:complete len:283 (-) Transcript_132195:656-1504(-)